MPRGWFFERGRTNGRHKTRNGCYLGLVGPISSIVGLLILYSGVLRVNNSLVRRVRPASSWPRDSLS